MTFGAAWGLLWLLCAAKSTPDEAPRPSSFVVQTVAPEWKTFGGLNCWHTGKIIDGLEPDVIRFGSPVQDVDELAEITLDECRERCVEDTSCEGILTIHRHVEPDQPPEGPCWLRRDLTSTRCVTNTPWDLHVLDNRVAFSRVDASEGSQDTFDCNAGLEQWEQSWSDRKKEYCCQATGLRCTSGSLPTYDCTAPEGEWLDWSADKKAYCCETSSVACGVGDFDCNEGRANWETGWSDRKKDYCCSEDGVSCVGVRAKSYLVLFDESHRLTLILLLLLVLVFFICLIWLVLVLAGCCGGYDVAENAETVVLVERPPPVQEPLPEQLILVQPPRIVQVDKGVQVSTLMEQRIPVRAEKDVQVATLVERPAILQVDKDVQVSTLVEQPIVLVEQPTVVEPVLFVQEPQLPQILQFDKGVQVSTLMEQRIPMRAEKDVQVATLVERPAILQVERDVQVATLVERPAILQVDKDIQVSTLVEQRIPLRAEKDVQVATLVERPAILQVEKDVQVATLVERPAILQVDKDVQVATLVERPAILQVEKDVQVATLVERPAILQVEKDVQVATLVQQPPIAKAERGTQVSTLMEYAQVSTLVEQPTILQAVSYAPAPQQVIVARQPPIMQVDSHAQVPGQLIMVKQPPVVQAEKVNLVDRANVVERSYFARDHLLGVHAPGYGPMNVSQSYRATVDIFRSSAHDHSHRSMLDQMLTAPRY